MYAVIFRATVHEFDADYERSAARLRELAFERYGCRDFVAFTEGDQEVAISYWDSEADILRWKQDPEHTRAQQRGRERWYADYTVQVVEVVREYGNRG